MLYLGKLPQRFFFVFFFVPGNVLNRILSSVFAQSEDWQPIIKGLNVFSMMYI